MNPIIKKLAGQTAVYGLSSIVGRLLNYLLVPYYTRLFLPEEYGVITEIYSYTGIAFILLTYGLETGYFRFSTNKENEAVLYSTLQWALSITGFVFLILIFLFQNSINGVIGLKGDNNYVFIMALTVAMDAFLALPYARLRYLNKAYFFAITRLSGIFLNIGLNLLFFETNFAQYTRLNMYFSGVGYVFISNLISTLFTLFLISPYLSNFKVLNYSLFKQVFRYSYPILFLGLAGMINESGDKILLKYILQLNPEVSAAEAMNQLGIYGANYKIAIFMMLFIQAFRFAADPFFFKSNQEGANKSVYSMVLNYFVFVGGLVFLGIITFMDFIKLYIDEAYHAGLSIVPILLIAKWIYGIVFSMSFWYKVSDKTIYGLYITLLGGAVTLIGSFLVIPGFGYYGLSYVILLSYTTMAIASYFWGQKFYPVPYQLRLLFVLIAVPIALYFALIYSGLSGYLYMVAGSIAILFYLGLGYMANKKVIFFKK